MTFMVNTGGRIMGLDAVIIASVFLSVLATISYRYALIVPKSKQNKRYFIALAAMSIVYTLCAAILAYVEMHCADGTPQWRAFFATWLIVCAMLGIVVAVLSVIVVLLENKLGKLERL